MARSGKNRNLADLLAGAMVLLVAAGLLVSVSVAMTQCTARLPESGTQDGTVTISTAPSKPPVATLPPNPYLNEEFTYDENGYLTCPAADSWLGVDVSEHQGEIQWDKVAQSDVQFAMVRLAYRGWGSEGVIRADARGLENLQGAADAGLKVGVYFFSQAITVEEAVEEARFLLELLDGRPLDMPVVFDWEKVSSEDARTANMKRSTLNACALAFCAEIEAAGYDAMVYFNLDLGKWMFNLPAIWQEGYDFWLAMYSDALRYAYQVRMWQYTSTGSVAGIKGKVDLNLYFPEESK